MIYSCGEYEVGDSTIAIDQKYRKNAADYPDHFRST